MSRPRIAWVLAAAAVAAGAAGSATALTMNKDEPAPAPPKDVRKAPLRPADPGYWTKDRMRKAKPYPMPLAPPKGTRPADPGPSGPGGGVSGAPPRHP
jgi:hypothetical protein